MSRTNEAYEILSAAEGAQVERVGEMEARRKDLKRQQLELTRNIKNENRKRQRLMQKARCLSENELLTVLGARAARAKAKAVAKAKAS